MFDSVIHQIFDMYLDNDLKDIKPLLKDEWQYESNLLEEFENQHDFSVDDRTRLECSIIASLTYKSELKGFENGFKLAIRLISELCFHK